MRFSFLKSCFIGIAALCAWNCSDSAAPEDDPASGPAYKICPEAGLTGAFHLSGGMDLIIYPDMVVTDGDANIVGSFLITEPPFIGSIIATSGKTLLQGIDLMSLPVEQVNTAAIVISGTSWLVSNGKQQLVIRADEVGTVTDVHGNYVGLTDMTGFPLFIVYSATDGAPIATVSIDTAKVLNPGDRCTTVPPVVESSSSIEPGSSNGETLLISSSNIAGSWISFLKSPVAAKSFALAISLSSPR